MLAKITIFYCSKDVRLPLQLQRAMAAEAEAAREARAKVIAAEGEKNAAVSLRSASDVITDNPAAMQLRYLQVGHSQGICRYVMVKVSAGRSCLRYLQLGQGHGENENFFFKHNMTFIPDPQLYIC